MSKNGSRLALTGVRETIQTAIKRVTMVVPWKKGTALKPLPSAPEINKDYVVQAEVNTPQTLELSIQQLLQSLTKALEEMSKPEKPKKGLRWWVDKASNLPTIGGIILFVLLAFFVTSNYLSRDGSVVVEEFNVPADAEKAGYSARVISEKLADHIKHIVAASQLKEDHRGSALNKNADNKTPLRLLDNQEKMPDVELPGTRISLSTLLTYMGQWLRLRRVRIRGHAVMHDKTIALSVTVIKDDVSEVQTETKSFDVEPGGLDKTLAEQVTPFILKQTDPYILAAYYSQRNMTAESLDVIQDTIHQKPIFRDPDEYKTLMYTLWGVDLAAHGLGLAHDARSVGDRNEYQGAAIEKYKMALEIDRWNYLARLNWGDALSNLGRYEAAEEKYQESLKTDGEKALTHYYLGNLYVRQWHYREAENHYRQALNLDRNPSDPRYANGYFYWGRMLLECRMDEEALEVYQKLVEVFPTARSFSDLGYVLELNKRYAEAEQSYIHAIKLDAGYARAYDNYGGLLGGRGAFAEAEKRLKQALEIEPDSDEFKKDWAQVLQKWGDMLESQHKFPEALSKYRELVKLKIGGEIERQAKQSISDVYGAMHSGK